MIRLLTLCFVLLSGLLAPWTAHAELRIDITKGGLNPMPIAVPDFVSLGGDGGASAPAEMGIRIAEVVNADLERSGLFRPLDPKAFLQDPVSLWKGPDFRNWRLLNADAVVSGAVASSGDKLTARFVLHDVNQGSRLLESAPLSAPSKDWRYLAHRIADEIYSRLTGEGGYFTSRIGFVAQKNIDARRFRKWLSVMDQDGANRTDLNPNEILVLTRVFRPMASIFTTSPTNLAFPGFIAGACTKAKRRCWRTFPASTPVPPSPPTEPAWP